MELDLQSLFGLHVTWCAQLYSLTEPQQPLPHPIPPHLDSYRGALLVSKDRRQLFVTPDCTVYKMPHMSKKNLRWLWKDCYDLLFSVFSVFYIFILNFILGYNKYSGDATLLYHFAFCRDLRSSDVSKIAWTFVFNMGFAHFPPFFMFKSLMAL